MATVNVTPIAETNISPKILASHAAGMCYTAESPKLGKEMDVEKRLFNTGHHSTLEHNYWTFMIENIPVSSVIFGLHLTAPFYNTDQRSGRFSKMYDNPDMADVRNTLETYYPGIQSRYITDACNFIENGLNIYADNKERITEMARDAIHRERPNAKDEYVESNAPKFAQEQLRVFISQVMPTALVMTVNTSALAALWRVAWSQEMRRITDGMRDELLRVQPDLTYMFDPEKRQNQDWNPCSDLMAGQVLDQPICRLISADIGDIRLPNSKDAVDLLPFSPVSMNNQLSLVKTEITTSCGTMGRSIHRGEPVLTGDFYLPPLLRESGLKAEAEAYLVAYRALANRLSPALMTTIAPYGMMAKYMKVAHLNALLHEQGKRLCWCAQEEISDLSRQLREQIIALYPALAERLAPPCYRGKCLEGVRFCGRQINKDKFLPAGTGREIRTLRIQRESTWVA